MTTPFADDSGARATLPRARRWRIGIGTLGAGAAVWARWRPFRVEVEGTSMAPDVAPGEWLVAIRTSRVRRGDVVVFEHPDRPGFDLVKRVAAIPGDTIGALTLKPGEYWVLGDAREASTDSRWFGPVPLGRLRGVVVLRYRPPSRARWLRPIRVPKVPRIGD